MRTTITTAAIAATALLTLTACTSTAGTTPNLAACKAAMEKQFTDAVQTGAQGTRPPQCDDIDNATVQRLAAEIINEQLGATPTP